MTTNERAALAKTNRINYLFDFYAPLLTDKQRTFLTYYFHDDFSLGEISAEFAISRQAVYEHLKRAEQALEGYERKLGLLGRHETMRALIGELDALVGELPGQGEPGSRLRALSARLRMAEGLASPEAPARQGIQEVKRDGI
ncbi:YlxM family DNA-binding protein [Paenibacillus sp. IB182496]|uniref:UPF0122 protein IDH44_12995 n=1 Tax=Paenibacillus sabuli TaxID=2772509 RepID=A0A927BUX5_9BACL|nr:YlxM family DNA-binding protein [Paenibacillus sabuli]MBD2846115.1 YlxM family DNA-binding protein [Paenibacillus sabuli]